MVSFTTTSTLSLLALSAMLQPILGARAITGVAAGLMGAHSRRDLPEFKRDAPSDSEFQSQFTDCVAISHQTPPTISVNSDKSIVMNGLAQICIDEINHYNQLPNIKTLEAVQGKVEVIGEKSIKVTGVASWFVDYFEGLAGPV